MSQLEFVCHELVARGVITKNFHAYYSIEGIEYSWGYSKDLYFKYSLTSNKGKYFFDNLFARCISREVITKDLVRKSIIRAWRFMETYKVLK